MVAPGAAICIAYTNSGEGSTGNQADMGLTTVTKQPGRENGGHPFTTTYLSQYKYSGQILKFFCDTNFSVKLKFDYKSGFKTK